MIERQKHTWANVWMRQSNGIVCLVDYENRFLSQFLSISTIVIFSAAYRQFQAMQRGWRERGKVNIETRNVLRHTAHTHTQWNRYNICLQMTCHTFIWLHDWNNQRKLLYRKQISSHIRSVITAQATVSVTVTGYTAFRMHFDGRQVEKSTAAGAILLHRLALALRKNCHTGKVGKCATLAHNETQSWSIANTHTHTQLNICPFPIWKSVINSSCSHCVRNGCIGTCGTMCIVHSIFNSISDVCQ